MNSNPTIQKCKNTPRSKRIVFNNRETYLQKIHECKYPTIKTTLKCIFPEICINFSYITKDIFEEDNHN